MINGVEGLFKIDENYTINKAIININYAHHLLGSCAYRYHHHLYQVSLMEQL